MLTFFSCGSLTESLKLLSALRIWDAATDVLVFSNACSKPLVSFWCISVADLLGMWKVLMLL